MTNALLHRGPDGSGLFLDAEAGVGLGHTRLAILDPGERGAQPMHAAGGRVVLTYNGEIYNTPELRERLAAHHEFKTRTDTEVILRAYQQWGRECVHELNGMFAFALWDQDLGELWVVRDRLGIKPLYYSRHQGTFRFASEVRGITADADCPRDIDLGAVDAFLRFRYVPPPRTLFEGIRSLPPGHEMVVTNGSMDLRRYWQPDWESRTVHDVIQARERFGALLDDAVRMQLLSDVPLGVFLSGGMDSGVVATLAARHATRPVQAFSIGFEDGPDELEEARARALELGCEHHTFVCSAADFARLPEIVRAMDMPVGDSVVVPTFLLSKVARKHVKTVLTGEGGDELLAGYAHQRQLAQLARAGRWMPPGVGSLLGLAARVLPVTFWDRFFAYGGRLGRAGVDRMVQLASTLRDPVASYLEYTSVFGSLERERLYRGELAPLGRERIPTGSDCGALAGGDDSLRNLMRHEIGGWLPGNILMKQDVLTMCNSLEGRVPLLDHRLVEEVASWDRGVFAKLSEGKEVLGASLPERSVQKKKPFMLAVAGRTRETLLAMLEEHLFSGSSRIGGWVDMSHVRTLAQSLDESPLLRSKQLTALLVLELWLGENA